MATESLYASLTFRRAEIVTDRERIKRLVKLLQRHLGDQRDQISEIDTILSTLQEEE